MDEPSSPKGLSFRRGEAPDVAALAALVERAYRGVGGVAGWTHEGHLVASPRSDEEEIRGLLQREGGYFLVAEASRQEIVGCAFLQRRPEATHFGMFAVEPRRQAGGIGSAVLAAAEDAARTMWSSPVMTMHVISAREELLAWYERRGYARSGAREPFPFEGQNVHRDDFDFLELRKKL